jgi:hypothetical protein
MNCSQVREEWIGKARQGRKQVFTEGLNLFRTEGKVGQCVQRWMEGVHLGREEYTIERPPGAY